MNMDDMYINDYDDYINSIKVSIFGIIDIANKRIGEIEKAFVVCTDSLQKQQLQELLERTHGKTNDILNHIQDLSESVNLLRDFDLIFNSILNGTINNYIEENNLVTQNVASNDVVNENNVVFSNETVTNENTNAVEENVESTKDVEKTTENKEEVAEAVDNKVESENKDEVTDTVDNTVETENKDEVTETVDNTVETENKDEVTKTVDNTVETENKDEVTDTVDNTVESESTEEVTDTVDNTVESESTEEVTETADNTSNSIIPGIIVNNDNTNNFDTNSEDVKNTNDSENSPLIPLIQGSENNTSIDNTSNNVESYLTVYKNDSNSPRVILITDKQFLNSKSSLVNKELLVKGKGLFEVADTNQNSIQSNDDKKALAEQMMAQVSVLYSKGKADEAQKIMEEAKTLMNEVKSSSDNSVIDLPTNEVDTATAGIAYQKVA